MRGMRGRRDDRRNGTSTRVVPSGSNSWGKTLPLYCRVTQSMLGSVVVPWEPLRHPTADPNHPFSGSARGPDGVCWARMDDRARGDEGGRP